MTTISMTVNGMLCSGDVEGRTLLSGFLRDGLGLTGTHVGCDTSQCGACVVHVDGQAVKACTMFVAQADGKDITTIEGIGGPDNLHPLQEAFKEHHGLQCGYCTPGMITRASKLLEENPNPTEEEIRFGMAGNICRCTGYQNIVKSIKAAAAEMNAAKEAAQ